MMKSPVTVLALGGTIAMTAGDAGGVVPTLTGESLVAAVPGLEDIAEVNAWSFRQLPGAHLRYDDLEALAETIFSLNARGQRGVVVTQGTDTIEETAFTLDRLLDLEMPVVITGAMRNPAIAGADGPANLLAAIQVAVSDEARGNGCLVVLNDEIHAARFVRKAHTSRLDAFISPLCGRVGWVSEGRVHMCCALAEISGILMKTKGSSKRTALVKIAMGDDGGQIRALRSSKYDGLVVEATGGGHVPPDVADALEEAARKIPVVLASRTGTGQVLGETYGFSGGEIDLQRRGLIRAGWLDGLKAKVLLTLLLRHGVAGYEAVCEAFRPWGGGGWEPVK
ncbi:L-asparaginase [Castellaniella defragrans]